MNNIITFCDENAQKIETEIIANYESLANKKLYPADPIRIFLQGLAYVIAHQRAVINETGRQNLIKYAVGDKLDAIGEFTGTKRIPESAAATTVTFTRVKNSSAPVLIRTGTRITADSKIYFKTVTDVVIPESAPSATARCVAMTAGVVGNGYKIGAINKIVDPIAYVASVTNITESAGGNNTESDDALRERIYIAPESFSVAGPILAYKYFAKSTDAGIEDIAIISPEAGKVNIYPLMQGGELPTQEILDKVALTVNNEKVRPLTDFVTVSAPVRVYYNLNVDYYLYSNSEVTEQDITAAAERYITWQGSKLGRDINPDKLRAELMGAGAKRIELAEPIFTSLQAHEVAKCGEILITFKGLEDE